MVLLPKNKETIDSMSYRELLSRWRNDPVGSPWFQGATEGYWRNRMRDLRSWPGGEQQHVEASKSIG